MNHATLFSGIGAPEFAASALGWNNVFHCEINPFSRHVLEYYYPQSISYHDITKTDFHIHARKIDVLTGGFPCQPFSVAGKRKGTEDHRNLWGEMLRAVREIQPRWVVGENVPGLLSWSKGLVFNQVQTDLEDSGYSVIPFVLPACGKDAPHRRDRVWIIAYRDGDGFSGDFTREKGFKRGARRKAFSELDGVSGKGIVADTQGTGSQRKRKQGQGQIQLDRRSCEAFQSQWQNFPTQPPVRGRNDGISARLSGKTLSPGSHAKQSIMAYGNSMVPQVVLGIYRAIEEWENQYLR